MRTAILSVLTWVQSVFKDNQQTAISVKDLRKAIKRQSLTFDKIQLGSLVLIISYLYFDLYHLGDNP